MRRILFCLIVILSSVCSVKAQQTEPIYHETFDRMKLCMDSIHRVIEHSESVRSAFTPTYTKGLKGYALDLTDNVADRLPISPDTRLMPDYSKSFAISVWVMTKPNARQGTAIMSNKRNYNRRLQVHREIKNTTDEPATDELNAPGWLIGTDERGAWYFYISDGEHTYTYSPTAEKQCINNGTWHHIAVSIDIEKKELWLYFDGRNVAIYNIEGLTSAKGSRSTVIGGTDEYTEKGYQDSRREWAAFNGKIDEVKCWNRAISAGEVKSEYSFFHSDKDTSSTSNMASLTLKVQVWNIFHGGNRFGQNVGVQRVIDVLKRENADIIGLIETYGAGSMIADSLGYYYYLISDNLSIMSRYPIKSTIQLYQAFKSGGVVLDMGDKKEIAFFDVWLDWREDYRRSADIIEIQKVICKYANQADRIPTLVVGDFNSSSHLDISSNRNSLNPNDIWPSCAMAAMGFKDSFRQMHVNAEFSPGFTWSPLINRAASNQYRGNRIDYIYYKGMNMIPYYSQVIDHHPVFWPSDHASVISYFYLQW